MKRPIILLIAILGILPCTQAQLFFKPTTHTGAFGAYNWAEDWTNWNAANTSYPAATIVVENNITSNTTWTKDNTYLLKGYVYVKNGATLTIEPGTIIRCDANTTASLIVTRNSKIHAVGTALNPIVFTSSKAPGSRNFGDWGGILLLGNAKINVSGGTADVGAGINNGSEDGVYGGISDNDSSGALDFVRIEFAGVQYQPDKEIGGLTLAGVGSKTSIKHIQISFCGNDAIKFLGGTAQASYLISNRCFDTDFFMDLGYRGKLQFAVVLRDSTKASATGFSSIEVQNDGLASTAQPLTDPTLSNITLLGPITYQGTFYNSNYRNGIHIKRNARCAIFNSAIAGYPKGILLDGSGCGNHLKDGYILIENCTLAGNKLAQGDTSGNFSISVPKFDFNTWYSQFERNNQAFSTARALMLKNPYAYTNPDFTPQTGSPVLSGASFLHHRLSALNQTQPASGSSNVSAYYYQGKLYLNNIPSHTKELQILLFDLQGKRLSEQRMEVVDSAETIDIPNNGIKIGVVEVRSESRVLTVQKVLFD